MHIVLADDRAWDDFDHELYYREMVARFGHHPALMWNIGEEASEIYTDQEQIKLAGMLKEFDPYDHPVYGASPADLAVLPVEWLEEFFQMLRTGRSAKLIDMIGRIPPEHADLAGTLAEWVHVYRFYDLIVATEGAIKEASNG